MVEARGVCWWLADQLALPLTLDELAAHLNKVAHAARKGKRRIEKQRLHDKWLRDSTDQLLAELRA